MRGDEPTVDRRAAEPVSRAPGAGPQWAVRLLLASAHLGTCPRGILLYTPLHVFLRRTFPRFLNVSLPSDYESLLLEKPFSLFAASELFSDKDSEVHNGQTERLGVRGHLLGECRRSGYRLRHPGAACMAEAGAEKDAGSFPGELPFVHKHRIRETRGMHVFRCVQKECVRKRTMAGTCSFA